MANWLAPEGFRPLDLSEVPDVGLMLPYQSYSAHTFIIGYFDEQLWAINYNETNPHRAIKCENAHGHSGLYIPNLQFEIDLSSAFDVGSNVVQQGSLIRKADKLYVAALIGERSYPSSIQLFILVQGLEVSGVADGVAFSKWRVKVGDDNPRSIFMDFDLSTQSPKDV